MPSLYIIAGPNGAGKTTASYAVLPQMLNCNEFVNADEIARGLSPFQPEKVAIEAGRIMVNRIDELIKQKTDFAFETTLAPKSHINTINKAKENNYIVTLVFFWLNSVDLSIERVKMRVMDGGHNIPENVIRRRFINGIYNLTGLYLSLVDFWLVIDNSTKPYKLIAEGEKDNKLKIYQNEIWENIINAKNGK